MLDKKQKELLIVQIAGQVEEIPEIILAFPNIVLWLRKGFYPVDQG
ncbi:hypothetical protein SAMN05660649_00191 [Desulfotomaculum arcticum]|uniref:Uncharacterized protein n=1 Tax=Desulfotruncus arcticus DSM 17038 TaxID=1121424 RepID=A0A1I2MVU0_9FIRM|nr:hypothetical protein [Desulfotruncus arcticus]SFF95592.1 hypothetical protein SAMN05660649_00191 [Desulfotomaculum arcticum] [Desulfotruncus arcticus DSM 17038]